MSLQVSNQTTTGRRTPQVYQGFGSVPTGSTTTPTATNGGALASGANAGGSVGRAAKGGNKQSQIPVAIGSSGFGTPGNDGSVPQTAVVYPGTAGATDGTPGQKQVQSDHLYGLKQQQQQVSTATVPAPGAPNRSATNGNQSSASVEKNGTSQRKNSTGDASATAKKTETVASQPAATPAEGTAKVRDSPRSSARTQQQKQSVEEAEPAKTTDQPKTEKNTELESSIMAENPLKGFTSDGEEMESLLLEPWDLEGPSTPVRSNAGGKSRLQKANPQAQARVSPFKASGKASPKQSGPDTEQTVDTSNKKKAEDESEKNRSPKVDPAPSTPSSAGAGESLIGRPLRSISGRRSTRPITDIKFTHPRRSTADAHNDSISSMNVTVGSEIGNDSLLLRTPGSATRKRKDMTPESTSDEPVAESPKRARLDFSGLLGMVATPVTMLKNRLSRVKLQSSTPRSLVVDEEDASKVVTAEATTTTVSVTPQKEGEVAAMEVDVAGKGEEKSGDAATTDKVTVVVPGEGQKKDGAAEGQQESSSSVAEDDDAVEVKIVTDQPKQWCSIIPNSNRKVGLAMWILAVFVALLYAVCDVNYFIRTLFTVLHIMLLPGRVKITDKHTIYGFCTTQDVDFLLNHMNNGRYLRELDFCRFYWYGRTRFWPLGNAKNILQGECMVRYRRMLPIFKAYKVETQLIWWDDKSIYFEHKFVTLHDGFIRTVAYTRQRAIGVNLLEYVQQFPECRERPEQPTVLKGWIESNEASSQQLRK
uniref:Protein THEM6 n=1 Tax=Anopheles epiroticus TaxID=199890 RepID=A0A182P8W1_9DIPT